RVLSVVSLSSGCSGNGLCGDALASINEEQAETRPDIRDDSVHTARLVLRRQANLLCLDRLFEAPGVHGADVLFKSMEVRVHLGLYLPVICVVPTHELTLFSVESYLLDHRRGRGVWVHVEHGPTSCYLKESTTRPPDAVRNVEMSILERAGTHGCDMPK